MEKLKIFIFIAVLATIFGLFVYYTLPSEKENVEPIQSVYKAEQPPYWTPAKGKDKG